MAMFADNGVLLIRTVLLGTTALAFALPLGITDAVARVGVTSATDGDPLGKPPTEAERVLRIGVDVQANEQITTRVNDRAHLLFLDGSSLTVGPNAQLVIDRFVFDPNTKTGDLAITATKGVFRLVGGKISKNKPITINTPSSTIGIRGGIALMDIGAQQTTSTFVFGRDMTVSGSGKTETVTRPGSQVVTNFGRIPGLPTLVAVGSLNGQLSQLEGRSRSSSQSSSTAGNADQKAENSGFSKQNSGGQAAITGPKAVPSLGRGADNLLSQTTDALTNRNTAVQEQQALKIEEQVQTTTPSPTPTPPATKVIVTSGRYLRDPVYTSVNTTNGMTVPNPQNTTPLAPTGTVTNGIATITLSDGRSISVPWQPGAGLYAINLSDPVIGPLTGQGVVSPTADYFAFTFVDSSNRRVGIVGGTPTTLAQFPTSGIATHTIVNASNGGLPFTSNTVGNDPQLKAAARQSPLLSVFSPDAAPGVGDNFTPAGKPFGGARASALQATISISGQGASQKSYMGVFIGEYFRDYSSNTMFNGGNFTGSYRLGATQGTGRLVSGEATLDTGAGGIFGANAERIIFTSDGVNSPITLGSDGRVATATTTRTSNASIDANSNNVIVDYYSVNAATRTENAAGLGQSRTSGTLNGYVGGLVEKRDASGNFTTRTIGTTVQPTDLVLTKNAATNEILATITIPGWADGSGSATFRLGNSANGHWPASTFVDDQTFGLRDRQPAQFPTTTSVTVGNATSTGTTITSQTSMVSYNTAPVAEFFQAAGVTPCACEFLTWGWWGGNVGYAAGSVYNGGGRDRLNLATFVTGNLSTVTALNNLNTQKATATYTGHLVGNVASNGTSYVAAGSYTNIWSFGQRSGITTTRFDGVTYGGGTVPNTILSGNGPAFSAQSLPAAGSTGRTMATQGAFFSSPTDPAKYQAGRFTVTGPAYTAGGTFAGQKP